MRPGKEKKESWGEKKIPNSIWPGTSFNKKGETASFWGGLFGKKGNQKGWVSVSDWEGLLEEVVCS